MWLILAGGKWAEMIVSFLSTDFGIIVCFYYSSLSHFHHHPGKRCHSLIASQVSWEHLEKTWTQPAAWSQAQSSPVGLAYPQLTCRYMRGDKFWLFSTIGLWGVCHEHYYTNGWLIHLPSQLLLNTVFYLLANTTQSEKELGGIALKGGCQITTYWSSDYTYLKQKKTQFF